MRGRPDATAAVASPTLSLSPPSFLGHSSAVTAMVASPAAGRGTAAIPRIGESVAAVPETSLSALLGSLHEELGSLQLQYDALAALANDNDGVTPAEDRATASAGAANLLVAMDNKRAQIQLLSASSAHVGTLGAVVRSPVQQPLAASRRAEAMKTMAKLKGLAQEANTL